MTKLNLGVNPLMVRELRSYMRGTRACAVLTVYIAIISGIALLLYLGVSLANPALGVGNSSEAGSILFYIVVGLQLVLVSFVAPAFTVSAITSERERRTFDLLKVTLLSPRQIVWSKLVPVLGYVLLLVLATIPLFSLAFLLGGVEAGQLAAALCVILSSSALFTTLGLFVSSRAPSTLGATIVTYSIVVGIVIGLLVLTSLVFPALAGLGGWAGASGAGPVFTALFIALISLSPVGALVASEANFVNTGNLLTLTIRPLGLPAPIVLPAPFLILTACYLGASGILLWLTVRAVRDRA